MVVVAVDVVRVVVVEEVEVVVRVVVVRVVVVRVVVCAAASTAHRSTQSHTPMGCVRTTGQMRFNAKTDQASEGAIWCRLIQG